MACVTSNILYNVAGIAARKRRWTNEEVELLHTECRDYLKRGSYPPGAVINNLMKILPGRSAMVIRSKIQQIKMSAK